MSRLCPNIIFVQEAEEVLKATIKKGESLLLNGVGDFSEILGWFNLAELALETIPSCRDSFGTCLDWFGSNRERVEVALTILRDALAKIRNPLYFGMYQPSTAYRMLIEEVCAGRPSSGSQYYPYEARSLSYRNFFVGGD